MGMGTSRDKRRILTWRMAIALLLSLTAALCAALSPGIAAQAAFFASARPTVTASQAALAVGAHAFRGVRGIAEEAPGTAALNQGGDALVYSISCAAAGNCSAVGDYADGTGANQVFVISEEKGTWHTAQEVPGTGALNLGGDAIAESVSCPSPGSCGAGGQYKDSSGHYQAFVVDDAHGTWGTAEEVPGTAALNQGGRAVVASVSCPSAGNCSAGGRFSVAPGNDQAFVANEAHGTWGTAQEVPGIGALNLGGDAIIWSMSCPSAGNCSAGGIYTDGSGHAQAFVVNEAHGTWGTAQEVPGTAALNKGGQAGIRSVSCASAGNCSAGGFYAGGSGIQAFVVNEAHGIWGTAREVPGTAALNRGGYAQIFSVSCASAGNCSAGGLYTDGSRHSQAFVVNEAHGIWGTTQEVPGTAALNRGGYAEISSISCASAGNCSAGGSYTDRSGNVHALAASETGGTWGRAREVPGTAALNQSRDVEVVSVSCPSAGSCGAAGLYRDSSGHGHYQALVVSNGRKCRPPGMLPDTFGDVEGQALRCGMRLDRRAIGQDDEGQSRIPKHAGHAAHRPG